MSSVLLPLFFQYTVVRQKHNVSCHRIGIRGRTKSTSSGSKYQFLAVIIGEMCGMRSGPITLQPTMALWPLVNMYWFVQVSREMDTFLLFVPSAGLTYYSASCSFEIQIITVWKDLDNLLDNKITVHWSDVPGNPVSQYWTYHPALCSKVQQAVIQSRVIDKYSNPTVGWPTNCVLLRNKLKFQPPQEGGLLASLTPQSLYFISHGIHELPCRYA